MASLYVVSILIFIRSIVRVVEYVQGFSGYIMHHEAFLYVFDGVVMWAAVVCMNWIHPGQVAQEIRSAKHGGSDGQMGVKDGVPQNKDGVMMDYVSV